MLIASEAGIFRSASSGWELRRMIIRERPNVMMLFFVLRGSVVQRIWPQILSVGVLAALLVGAHRLAPDWAPRVEWGPFSLIGIALSIFLSFRNGASYDRWWEARKLWGQILQTARDVARQTLVLDEGAAQVSPERKAILSALIAFGHLAVRHQRREPTASPHPLLNPADAPLAEAALVVARLLREGRLAPIEALALNESFTRLNQALVGCERLANTPLPFAYTLLLHRTAYLFCFLLPFGLVGSLGLATPLIAVIAAYTFFGLDAVGEELEQPFSLMPNALPISAYAAALEIAMRAAMGESELPPAPAPQGHILT